MLVYNIKYRTCDEIYTDDPSGLGSTAIGIIVGVVIAFVVIIIAVIVFLSWRAYKRKV
jgi:hypothetical protein